MKIGDIVQHKKTGNKMTIMRFIGDEENMSFISVDRQLETKGFSKGDPTCQWFIGTKLHTGTFANYELDIVQLKSAAPSSADEAAIDDDLDLDLDLDLNLDL